MQIHNKRSTLDAEVAHLLRHLRDPSALRENTIASRYFSAETGACPEDVESAALAAVRALLAGAVERVFEETGAETPAHARRQRAIIEYCDLHGRPHGAVANSLGLSRRQFYRERRHARKRLAQYFAPLSERVTPSLPNQFDLSLAVAESLWRVGRRSAAIASMKTLRKEAPDTVARVRANLALAGAYIAAGTLPLASDAVQQAKSAFGADAADIEDAQLVGLEIDSASAHLLWLTGKPLQMKSLQERILFQLRQQRSLRTERALELEAQASMRLGMLFRDIGDARESITYLRRAAGVLRSLPRASPALRAELAGNFGLTHMVLPNGLTEAAECMRAYLQVSREHNLLCDVADALASLSTLHMQSRDVAGARALARSGLDLARRVSSKQQTAEIAVIAALAEAEAGNVKASLKLIQDARSGVVRHSPGWALTQLAEAQALLYCGSFPHARRVAGEAATTMSSLGMTRYCGAALRIAAEAAEGAHRRTEAVRTIGEAIALLETHGHAASLARAYECQARLTRRRVHAHRARELRESLRAPLAGR